MKLNFTYYNIPYSYQYGQIYDAAGNDVCSVDISHTNYANNEEVLRICCYCALQAYEQGESNGKKDLRKQIRELLWVEAK